MKRILILLIATLSIQVTFSSENYVSGTVSLETKEVEKKQHKGALFIILRKKGVKRGPPVAVLKIDNPTFPNKFILNKKNIMIKGTEFKGPFWIKAKFVPDGNPLGEGQLLGEYDPEGGILSKQKDVKVILKKKSQ